MRFSDIPLWRRLLIVVVTLAICGAVYWIVAAIVAVTPLWLDAMLAVAVIGFGLWAAGDDRRKGLTRNRQVLLREKRKPRR